MLEQATTIFEYKKTSCMSMMYVVTPAVSFINLWLLNGWWNINVIGV